MSTLRTDYEDAVLDTSVNTRRKYNMIENSDGTISLEDVTTYSKEGDDYGALDINEQNTFINGLQTSFSQALTDLKATAIAQAVGAVGNTFASVIATLGTIVNRGKVTQTLNTSTTSYTIPEGYHNGEGTISITTETKTQTAGTSNVDVTPTSGKVLSKVTVKPTPSQSKTVTPTTRSATASTVNPDSGKLLSKVVVNTTSVPNSNTATYSTITSNGTHDLGETNNYRYVEVSVWNTLNVGLVMQQASELWINCSVGDIFVVHNADWGNFSYNNVTILVDNRVGNSAFAVFKSDSTSVRFSNNGMSTLYVWRIYRS